MSREEVDLSVKRTPSYIEAENELPEDKRALFELLVSDYQCSAIQLYGWKISAPKVLAELIKLGWKKD